MIRFFGLLTVLVVLPSAHSQSYQQYPSQYGNYLHNQSPQVPQGAGGSYPSQNQQSSPNYAQQFSPNYGQQQQTTQFGARLLFFNINGIS